MVRRHRLVSFSAAPEPTPEERLQNLNTAVEAIREDQVNKLVSTMPLGVDIKAMYSFRLVNLGQPVQPMHASLLHLAILNEAKECTKFLLHLGAPKEVPESTLGDCPLHCAIRLGHREAISLLLEYGVQPTTLNKRGDTPLHIAAGKGDVHTVKALLQEGADPHAQNRYNQTPWCVAMVAGTPRTYLCADLLAHSEPQEMSSHL